MIWLLAVLFTFTPSTDAGAVHVCVAWEWERVIYMPPAWGCSNQTEEDGNCSMLIGPKQIPCSVGGNVYDFPDPTPERPLTMARVYAVWP